MRIAMIEPDTKTLSAQRHCVRLDINKPLQPHLQEG